MGLDLGRLGLASIILALMYLFVTIYTFVKLCAQHGENPNLDTAKVFGMSIFLSSFFRVLSFLAISTLSFQSIAISLSDDFEEKGSKIAHNQSFYEKAVLVLFDLPDFITISAFVLLTMIWAEAFLQSRRHWLGSKKFRKTWLITYLVFNVFVYTSQLLLYSLLFFDVLHEKTLLTIIYIFLSGVNLAIPCMVLILYLYLSCSLAGFPIRSAYASKRFGKISKNVAFWTLMRIVWSVCTLITLTEKLFEGFSSSKELYSLAAIALFLATEISPFIYSMDDRFLAIISSTSNDGSSPLVSQESDRPSLLTTA